MSREIQALDRIDTSIREALQQGASDEIDRLLAERERRLRNLVRDSRGEDPASPKGLELPKWVPQARARLEGLLQEFAETQERVGAEWRELREARQTAAQWRDDDRPEARFLSRRA